ncbi:hypothetical protein [Candidatus Poriferisodalis sp.]|uniref:hypothetical protein n=1 Tax=Candidatus Poriferisodalis sp. TaxID=3101277 RepID=UPI003B024EFD
MIALSLQLVAVYSRYMRASPRSWLSRYSRFLGFGVDPARTATWGNMLGGNEGFMIIAPWLVWAPGLAIVATVLCVNFVGDGLRDAFDVKAEVRDHPSSASGAEGASERSHR